MPHGITVRELTRVYRPSGGGAPRVALNGVDFAIAPGEVCGLLGANGAGKTTLARILTTLLTPSSGSASVAGHDVVTDTRRAQHAVGVSFGGESGLYTRLSGADNLRFFGTMYGLGGRALRRRADELLARVGLDDRAGDRVETYSRGMRQRLHIARALVHDPSVVILDEPSGGLDVSAAQNLRALVRGLSADGRAVLLTTHDLAEVEALCHRLLILREGVQVADTTAASLREQQRSRSGPGAQEPSLEDAYLAALGESDR